MISVIMPIYNEGASIFTNLQKTREVMKLAGDFELIPVNDGSTDHSHSEIDRSAASFSEIRKQVILPQELQLLLIAWFLEGKILPE